MNDEQIAMVRAEAEAEAARAFRDSLMQSVKIAQLSYQGSAETATLLHEPMPILGHDQIARVLDRWLRNAKTAEAATHKRVLKSYGLE